MDSYLPVLTAVLALSVLLFIALHKQYLIQKFACAQAQIRPRGFSPLVMLASLFKSFLQYLRAFKTLEDTVLKGLLLFLFLLSFSPSFLLPLTGPYTLGEHKHSFEISTAKATILCFIAMDILWNFALILVNLRANRSFKGMRLKGLFQSFSAQQLISVMLFSLPLLAYKTLDLSVITSQQNLGLDSYGILRYPLFALMSFLGLFLYEVLGRDANRIESTDGHSSALREKELYLCFWPSIKETVYGAAQVIFFVCFYLGGHQLLPGLDKLLEMNQGLEIPLQFLSLLIKCALLQHLLLALELSLPHTVIQNTRKHFWIIFLVLVLVTVPLSLSTL